MDPLSTAGQDRIEGRGAFYQNWSVHVPGDRTACFPSGGPEHSGSIRLAQPAQCTTLSAFHLLQLREYLPGGHKEIVQQPVAQTPGQSRLQQMPAYISSSWLEI